MKHVLIISIILGLLGGGAALLDATEWGWLPFALGVVLGLLYINDIEESASRV